MSIARVAFEHGEQQRQAVAVDAGGDPASAVVARGDERLHLDEHRPCTLHGGRDHRARRAVVAVGEEQRRRVGYRERARPRSSRRSRPRGWTRTGACGRAGSAARGERSPSNEHTVSTTCSSVRGPASEPSLVTWPDEHRWPSPCSRARRVRRDAHSRTCVTDPGVPGRSGSSRVCTESTASTSGRTASTWATTCGSDDSATSHSSGSSTPRRSARLAHLLRRLLRADEQAREPEAARRPSAWSISVDLPMPGSPPSSVVEPSVSPPPSTRSSSPIPVARRGAPGRGDLGDGPGVHRSAPRATAGRRRRHLGQRAPRVAVGAAAQPAGVLGAALGAPVDDPGLRSGPRARLRASWRAGSHAPVTPTLPLLAPSASGRSGHLRFPAVRTLVIGFDLDMTLVDSRPGIQATLDALAVESGEVALADPTLLDALLRRNLDLEFADALPRRPGRRPRRPLPRALRHDRRARAPTRSRARPTRSPPSARPARRTVVVTAKYEPNAHRASTTSASRSTRSSVAIRAGQGRDAARVRRDRVRG